MWKIKSISNTHLEISKRQANSEKEETSTLMCNFPSRNLCKHCSKKQSRLLGERDVSHAREGEHSQGHFRRDAGPVGEPAHATYN